jgi:cytidylate kinase
MIVTIDGPAGAGKSTVARALAERLGFRLLDTGAMYRAVTLAALRADMDEYDADALTNLAKRVSIELTDDRVLLDDEDVTDAIRTPEVSREIHRAADNPEVRAHLVQLQRKIAANVDIVCEGRDQGTVAFPHADCKIFLVASPDERARRRHAELTERGSDISLDDVLADQIDRDRRDAARPVGALRKADDAHEVTTDGLTLDAVVDQLEAIVRRAMDC